MRVTTIVGQATNLCDSYTTGAGWHLVPHAFEESPIAPGGETWTVSKALTRCWTGWRREGLNRLCLKILGETVYRRLWLLALDLDELSVRISPRTEVAIRVLEGADRDLDLYTAFRVNTSAREFRRKIDSGGKCFVAMQGGRAISATWTYVGGGPIPYLGAYFEAGSSEILLEDSYTLPAFRGRNISPAVTIAMARYYRDRGFRLMLASVLPENRASLRVRQKTWFHICGMAGYVGPGPHRRHFCRTYPDFLPWGET
jgi:GNAT superfamily N-acetyltransferase